MEECCLLMSCHKRCKSSGNSQRLRIGESRSRKDGTKSRCGPLMSTRARTSGSSSSIWTDSLRKNALR